MRGDADMLEIMRLADEVLSNRLREGDAACQSLHGAARGRYARARGNAHRSFAARQTRSSKRSPNHHSFAGGEQRPAAGGDACEPDRQRSLSQLALRVLSGERHAPSSYRFPAPPLLRRQAPCANRLACRPLAFLVSCRCRRWLIAQRPSHSSLRHRSACLSGTRVETLESLQTCLGAALLSVAAALGDIRARAEVRAAAHW